ncbi:conjugal transfer protein TraO, partial [Escherichia coli]|nr:conjugal transfer protein TraO [Salmonella enterica]ELZ9105723.1 conjugal transfer protein TraO [Escherichia coli]
NDARSSSLSSGISPSVNRTSQAEQRSQARMQTAMEQRKAVMQRRYDEQPETP